METIKILKFFFDCRHSWGHLNNPIVFYSREKKTIQMNQSHTEHLNVKVNWAELVSCRPPFLIKLIECIKNIDLLYIRCTHKKIIWGKKHQTKKNRYENKMKSIQCTQRTAIDIHERNVYRYIKMTMTQCWLSLMTPVVEESAFGYWTQTHVQLNKRSPFYHINKRAKHNAGDYCKWVHKCRFPQ